MNEKNVTLAFQPNTPGKTRGQVLIQRENEVLYSDVIDIAKRKAQDSFLQDLRDQYPGIDGDVVRRLLLAEVGRVVRQEPASSTESPEEVNVNRIVRPHLFHQPEISGLSVPVAKMSGGRLQWQWELYVQWADGKRECLNLEKCLELPDGKRIWFLPEPDLPPAGAHCGWSLEGRKRWLDGKDTDPASLFQALAKAFNHFLDFPSDDAQGHLTVLSLWTILTYVYPAWRAVPYLSVGGPIGSGKSVTFDVLSRLVYLPIISSSMTAPCLFRTLDTCGGTLLLDEAERLRERSSEMAELRSILLAGYKWGQKAQRMEKQGESFRTRTFDVYGPKAVAAIKELPSALASRCIRIAMFRAPKSSPKPSRHLDKDPSRWLRLRDNLHAFALGQGRELTRRAHESISCRGLYARDLEVWGPLLVLADLVEEAGAEGLVHLLERHARESVGRLQEDTVPETDDLILRTLSRILNLNPQGVTAGQIFESAKEEDPSLFNLWTPRGVGAVLKRYGIRSRPCGGRRVFRPSDKQLKAIQDTYGIGMDPSTKEMVNLSSP